MYGNKKVFRLLSGITCAVFSGITLFGATIWLSIVTSIGFYNDLFIWYIVLYSFVLLFSCTSLIFSILLCVNKSPNGISAVLIALIGIIALLELADIIISIHVYNLLNFMWWIVVIVFAGIYIGTKEGDPPPPRANARIANPYNPVYIPIQPEATPPKASGIDDKIAVLDRLKGEGKLTDEEYKELLLKELVK